ncbi:MAG TPA: N-acetyltransferase [Ohtaekwangia sp.]|uniref:N-acetyltransferase n=1 Tax=Ohtaekwangia sp. TaxID=2066019 RepID=UPI002F9593A8
MYVTEISTGAAKAISITPVDAKDYTHLTAKRYFFKWKEFKDNKSYKVLKLTLKGSTDILGIIALEYFDQEQRIEIKLLASSRENMGKAKVYEGIAGNLIAYVCRQATKLHGADAAVTLFPKTKLIPHYIEKYKMIPAGIQLMLFGSILYETLKQYGYE